MIRAIILGVLTLACAFVFSLFFSVPGFSAGLHPRCNIDWPCVAIPLPSKGKEITQKTNVYRHKYAVNRLEEITPKQARRVARGQRLEQAMPFGSPMYPPETQRSFLGKPSGLVAPLAAKLASIQSACPGTVAISGVRHTYIAGTRRISLHASGKAVDVRGPYGCIYAQLRGWSGGYSTDAGRMRHIHISYDAEGGREMGLAFRHGGHRRHVRHRSGHRVAEAGR